MRKHANGHVSISFWNIGQIDVTESKFYQTYVSYYTDMKLYNIIPDQYP